MNLNDECIEFCSSLTFRSFRLFLSKSRAQLTHVLHDLHDLYYLLSVSRPRRGACLTRRHGGAPPSLHLCLARVHYLLWYLTLIVLFGHVLNFGLLFH